MKTPVPTCLLSSSHHKIAGYDASAFLPASVDVGGRVLPAQTGLRPWSGSIVSLIIVAALACAIAILAVAAADADTLAMTNHAVIVRYSGKIALGVAPVRRFDNTADAALARLSVWENQRIHLGTGTSQHFVAPVFPTAVSTGGRDFVVRMNRRSFNSTPSIQSLVWAYPNRGERP
jgi:hypothetical protein